MYDFNYYQPTEIRFGRGKVNEVGDAVKRFGTKCLIVTTPEFPEIAPLYARIKKILTEAGVKWAHFDQVQPNPTTENITAGADMAKDLGAEVMLGVGGGSSMDSAKAIAVEATHEGTAWDYLFFKTPPTDKTLPIVAVTTTSGTGAHVTQVAVMTETKSRTKSAIYNSIVFPRVSIVDPELMVTVPEHVTASTGWDVFCHSFESCIHTNKSPYIDLIAMGAIRLVVKNLPLLLNDLKNIEARTEMALADTYAGLSIANAGVTLPHGMGMAIGGMYPHIAHGETLAIVYPAFSRFTYKSAIQEFASMGRILNPQLNNIPDEEAAEKSCEEIDAFLKKIGMWMSLQEKGMPEEEIPELARASMVLPDYQNNPRVATETEMLEIVKQSYRY